jgi:dTDP-glucose pyrophosphorylase
MNYDYQKHLIKSESSITIGLEKLNKLGSDAILFLTDINGKLLGSLTDGDVRRGLLSGLNLESKVNEFVQENPKYIQKGDYNIQQIISYRESGLKVIPIIDQNHKVIGTINFRFVKSYLPIDAVIMAGGRGERLRPLTDENPKPMLLIGDKPIIEHNVDRISNFGIDNFWISVRYLGIQIKDYLKNGSNKGINIQYVDEDNPLGTIGCVSLIQEFEHEYILVTNSDILTDIDYEDFFLEFIKSGADFSVVTIPHKIDVPYAILETNNGLIKSFKEKPTYTYLANGGIYLMKKEICEKIPKNKLYDATDLLENLIKNNYKVTSYQLRGYWLDIGKHDDYIKAQEDIKHLTF